MDSSQVASLQMAKQNKQRNDSFKTSSPLPDYFLSHHKSTLVSNPPCLKIWPFLKVAFHSNNVLVVKIEGPVWHTGIPSIIIYPLVKVQQTPQPTNGKRTSMFHMSFFNTGASSWSDLNQLTETI